MINLDRFYVPTVSRTGNNQGFTETTIRNCYLISYFTLKTDQIHKSLHFMSKYWTFWLQNSMKYFWYDPSASVKRGCFIVHAGSNDVILKEEVQTFYVVSSLA